MASATIDCSNIRFGWEAGNRCGALDEEPRVSAQKW